MPEPEKYIDKRAKRLGPLIIATDRCCNSGCGGCPWANAKLRWPPIHRNFMWPLNCAFLFVVVTVLLVVSWFYS